MKRAALLFAFIQIIFLWMMIVPIHGAGKITMTIVYDNYAFTENTKTDWGFGCFIEGAEKTILFDTGNNGRILLENCDSLKIDLSQLDVVVLSHIHGDHTNGLNSVLDRKSDILVYMGKTFPADFKKNVINKGAEPIMVDEPIEICENVFSTGEIAGVVHEQALIVDTAEGLVVITGCSHPGIVEMLKRVKEIHRKEIYLVFGGFHLRSHSTAEVNQIIREFKTLGVKKCGATHCTGDNAIALFKAAYGDNYVQMGTGRVVQVAAKTTSIKKEKTGQHLQNFELQQNYPNPFNPRTMITYALPNSANVKLGIFNLLGESVKMLINQPQQPGNYSINWDGTNETGEKVTSGIYVCQLESNNFVDAKKMVFFK